MSRGGHSTEMYRTGEDRDMIEVHEGINECGTDTVYSLSIGVSSSLPWRRFWSRTAFAASSSIIFKSASVSAHEDSTVCYSSSESSTAILQHQRKTHLDPPLVFPDIVTI
jgi:hypothetical protein